MIHLRATRRLLRGAEALIGTTYGGEAVGSPVEGAASADASGRPFSGRPFSGRPLSGRPLSGRPLSGRPLSGRPLSGRPLSVWYATIVPLPYPGRSVVLFASAETLVGVVAPGRSLRTTLPVFQERLPRLLRRLGLPEAWTEARAADVAQIHVVRAESQTTDRRVLGTMTDLRHQIRADAKAARAFDRLDLDAVEDGLAGVPLTVLGTTAVFPHSHGVPAVAIAALAGR